MEAVDTYYADDITIVEGNGETFHGRETQKGRIEEWQKTIKEVHDGGLKGVAANEDTGHVFIESWMDVTAQDGNRFRFEEVAVQRWKDGKVVHERFYYNMPGA